MSQTFPEFEITLLSKPSCGGCTATHASLDRYGIEHLTRDMTEDPAALALAQELGYSSAPVVIVRQNGRIVDSWSQYQPGKVKALASRISEA